LIAIAKFISEHNTANPDFELEINRYSADSPEDAQDRTGYVYIEGSEDDLEDDFAAQVPTANDTLPARVNWVEQGAVTSVKDQGRCGCCWAISLTGAIESATAINSNFTYLQSMSFQQFISCDPTNNGCDGGNIVTGMVYALRNQKGGMSSLNDYPFTDEEGDTTGECQDKPVAVNPDDGKIVTTFSDGAALMSVSHE
jgi:C1A family cysteine protease